MSLSLMHKQYRREEAKTALQNKRMYKFYTLCFSGKKEDVINLGPERT